MILPPKPPPISLGITLICAGVDARARRGAASRTTNGPCVRAPDDDLAVLADARDAGVRLDVALVHHRRAELALDDDVGLGEALGRGRRAATPCGSRCWSGRRAGGGCPRRRRRARAGSARPAPSPARRRAPAAAPRRPRRSAARPRARSRAWSRRRPRPHDRGRAPCRAPAGCRPCRAGRARLRRRPSDLGRVSGMSVAGDDRLDARAAPRAARVDRDDARVRVRAAQHGAVQHARQREVGAVVGAAGHLVERRRGGSGRVPTYLNVAFAHRGAFPHLRGRVEHGADDLVVAGAAAQVAGQPVARFFLGRIRVRVEQRLGRDDEARRADAALQRRVLEELLLQRVQRSPFATPSIVVIVRPSASAASTRHDGTRRPSSMTEQAPQSPVVQPSLVPVRPSSSRSAVEQRLVRARRETRRARR